MTEPYRDTLNDLLLRAELQNLRAEVATPTTRVVANEAAIAELRAHQSRFGAWLARHAAT